MTDIKVGDWVCFSAGYSEVFKVDRLDSNGLWFRCVLYPFSRFRPATPAEIAAGHRIDEPNDAEKEAVTGSRSEFETLEEHQKALKQFNEATRKSYEEFIQEYGSDRQKLQLRCTPYTDKKGAYGSTDLDFGIQLWQHQQAVVDQCNEKIRSLEELAASRFQRNSKLDKEASDLSHKCWELQKQVDELTAQLKNRGLALSGAEHECAELQKRVRDLETENIDLRVEDSKHALSTFTPPKPAKVGWFACFKKALGDDHESN